TSSTVVCFGSMRTERVCAMKPSLRTVSRWTPRDRSIDAFSGMLPTSVSSTRISAASSLDFTTRNPCCSRSSGAISSCDRPGSCVATCSMVAWFRLFWERTFCVEASNLHLELSAHAGHAAHDRVRCVQGGAELTDAALRTRARQLAGALEREQLPHVVRAEHLEHLELPEPADHAARRRLRLGQSDAARLEVQDEEVRALLRGEGEAGGGEREQHCHAK